MPKIRVLLIEDNRLLREGISKMPNAEADMKVMSSSGNGDAFEKAQKLIPDVVLLDLGLKNQNSLTGSWINIETISPNACSCDGFGPGACRGCRVCQSGSCRLYPQRRDASRLLHTIRSVAKGARFSPPPMTGSLFSDRRARHSRGQNEQTDVGRQNDQPRAGCDYLCHRRREKQ